MANARLGARYAKSLFGLAQELGKIEEINKDMTFINDTFKSNRELVSLIDSPVIPVAKKEKIFNYLFQDIVQSATMKFYEIIFKKGRAIYADDISAAFVAIYQKHRHIEKARLTTATPVSDVFKAKIISYLEKKCPGQTIDLLHNIDPSLIGGFIINFTGLQMDKSVASELKLIEKQFSKNLYMSDY